MTYDGTGRAAGVRILVDGEPQSLHIAQDDLTRTMVAPGWIRIGGEGLDGAAIDEFRVYNRTLSLAEVRVLAEQPPRDDDWRDHALLRDPTYIGQREALSEALLERITYLDTVPEFMVMGDLPDSVRADLRARAPGLYDAPGEAVEPETPNAILPFGDDLSLPTAWDWRGGCSIPTIR